MTTFEIFCRNNGRFYYRVIADSGHNILSSDGYETKQECLDVIEQVKNNIINDKYIRITKLPEDEHKFVLSGDDGSIIGYSMIFHSRNQCDKRIEIMKEYLPTSTVTEIIKV